MILALKKTRVHESGSMTPGTVMLPKQSNIYHIEGPEFMVCTMKQKIIGFYQ
jgi:hypothetical protein